MVLYIARDNVVYGLFVSCRVLYRALLVAFLQSVHLRWCRGRGRRGGQGDYKDVHRLVLQHIVVIRLLRKGFLGSPVYDFYFVSDGFEISCRMGSRSDLDLTLDSSL